MCVCVQTELVKWIRTQRSIGIPVHKWMMYEQALLLHKQWYPSLWSGGKEPFKASEG